MSYPVLEDWFSTSIRRNRKSFIFATLSLTITVVVILLIINWFGPSRGSWSVLLILFGIPYLLSSYLLSGQRLRDMGATGWLALLWVPVNIADTYLSGAASLAFWIVLCVVPGTNGPNRYGADPLTEPHAGPQGWD